jgi:hypothetical protein
LEINVRFTASSYSFDIFNLFLENTEGTIKNGQSREIGNIGYTRRRQTKKKHNTICVGHHYAQSIINNVNKTLALLQTTAGKDEPNIVVIRKA